MITFTTEPQGKLLNAYNNSIIEFSSDSGISARAIITISGYTFTIAPNVNSFYFNMKEVVTALINQDAFSDTIEIDLPQNYLFQDSSLILDVTVGIKVVSSSGVVDTSSKSYTFLKSVDQVDTVVYEKSDKLRFLTPSVYNKSFVTYFEGLPFDITFYSDEAREVTIKNVRSSSSITINVLKGINRLFISSGQLDNKGFETKIPLYVGVNELEFIFDNERETIVIKKEESDCGLYLKFFNQSGSWSYWRFHREHIETIQTSSLDRLNSDFSNLEDLVSRNYAIGKESQRMFSVSTGKVYDYQRLLLANLFASPKIYLYTANRLQPFTIADWNTVDIRDTSNQIKDTRKVKSEFIFSIQLAKDYTQTYGS